MGIAPAVLHQADVGPVKPSSMRKLVLIQAALEPQCAYVLTKAPAKALFLFSESGELRSVHVVIVTPARRKSDLLL